jgi:hypothetical protein
VATCLLRPGANALAIVPASTPDESEQFGKRAHESGEKRVRQSMAEETPSAPEKLKELVTRFADNLESYRSGKYNETQIRREFIDPFFKLLGWDVDNEQGYAEAYKDVIHEDAIKIGGATKAPDYCFRIGGTRKFFVEAKKPSVDIKGDPAPAYQLRRYAWSAKLPLSILTDFEELAVYDCRKKPDQSDAASTARILYMRFTDFEERWPEIAGIFARESILKGSFDKYAESTKKKRGTAEVDDAFLAEIEQWREELARNMAIRNPDLSQRDLNVAVQRTIDRTLFLRICEDRGIEEYGTLKEIAGKSGIYQRLFARFRYADDRYNSGLFHFTEEKGRPTPPDTLTASLAVDDKVLKSILNRLYYPESPYEFSVLPADILGQVYERFLGKVIRLTKGHQAKVEEKPEVRKAGGVYYTPTYIVDYIVKETVGKLVDGKTPQEVGAMTAQWRPSTAKGAHPVRVVDPACGSGSFLLGAYQFLLDWYRDRYVEDGPKKHATGKQPRLYHHPSGEWRLTTSERKRILLSHIYGVDIDAQAVEVTKLSLLLKVLEGESKEVIDAQLQLVSERALPDLDENIKCGNSLIGPDFYDSQQTDLFDEEEALRINAFDWNAEFPEAFKAGGFDAVIGNPPYLGGREWKLENGRQYDYFVKKFSVAEYQFDIYVLFIEAGIRLLQSGGFLGFITPNTWLNNKSCRKLREFILDQCEVSTIADYSRVRVFREATVLPIVSTLKRSRPSNNLVEILSPSDGMLENVASIRQDTWRNGEGSIFHIGTTADDLALREKIESSGQSLDSLATVKFGIKIYETGKGTPPQKKTDAMNRIFESATKDNDRFRRYLEGKDVGRYAVSWQDRWLMYGANLAAPRNPALFEGERILVRRIVGARMIAAYTKDDFVTSQLLQIVKPFDPRNSRFLLGIINSSLIAYYFRMKYNRVDKTFPEIRIYELASFPIRTLDLEIPSELARFDHIVKLVQRMLDLHKRLAETKSDHTRKVIERDIKHTDAQIDKLVYELYGLTEEEIRIVEEATP